MVQYHTHRSLYWFASSCVFLFFALALTGEPQSMFGDSDMLWHIAAGDLMRETGAIPATDPWSFTAGDYRWLNIAWLWDVVFSYAYEQLGWHGPVALNAILIALTFSIVFCHALLRSSDNLVAIILTFIGLIFIVGVIVRPLQITILMTAVWMLILGIHARDQKQKKWLALLPLLMVLWVNCHGGFMVGLMAIGMFFLIAIKEKNWPAAKIYFITGAACFIASFLSPLGWRAYELQWIVQQSYGLQFITEWKPLQLSGAGLLGNSLAVLFILLVPRSPALPILPAERWFAYFWLLMGVMSVRNMSIFAIIAMPMVACALQQFFVSKKANVNPAAAQFIARLFVLLNTKIASVIALMSCAAVSLWLVSPAAKAAYQTSVTLPSLADEVSFLKTHYPNIRLLTHYNLAGHLIFETRGEIPVFVDPRAETAIPPSVMRDYTRFEKSEKGWDDMFDRYQLDGVLLPKSGSMPGADRIIDRFRSRDDWHLVYEGPLAVIFIRQSSLK